MVLVYCGLGRSAALAAGLQQESAAGPAGSHAASVGGEAASHQLRHAHRHRVQEFRQAGPCEVTFTLGRTADGAMHSHPMAIRSGNGLPIASRAALLFGICLVGCSRSPEFRLNIEGRDPQQTAQPRPRRFAARWRDYSAPPTSHKSPLTKAPRRGRKRAGRLPAFRLACDWNFSAAAGAVASDAQGNQRGLYRRHCVTCHGVSGDGTGPARRSWSRIRVIFATACSNTPQRASAPSRLAMI